MKPVRLEKIALVGTVIGGGKEFVIRAAFDPYAFIDLAGTMGRVTSSAVVFAIVYVLLGSVWNFFA
ncbi:hypothetical protein [Thalassovita sp.]|uniref:hypothetical protein n=1 Tax=Thalassovita sp. TaxID=1979401 RepID=UPI0029DE696A|nr:hypothetical protein [Thalassovita sp.]